MAERRHTIGWVIAGCVWGAMGCDAFGTPVAEGDVRVVPVDTRPAQRALTHLPSISGGTLALSGNLAVVADSDRDVISIVDLSRNVVTGRIALEAGDEPGRIAIDAHGVAHVGLRGSGGLLSVDPRTASIVRRTAVCGAPRGVAYDRVTDRLHVACAGGELFALEAGSGVEAWRTQLEVDLRDVVVRGDHLIVSRFKSAEQLTVDKSGHVITKVALTAIEQQEGETPHVFDPAFAWRSVGDATDGVVTLHQRAQRDEVVINTRPDPVIGGSSYGGGGGSQFFGPRCDGIVHSAVSIVGDDGRVRVSQPIPDVVLAVDAAVSSQWIALAVAGHADPNAPRPFVVAQGGDPGFIGAAPIGFGQRGGVVLVSKSSLTTADGGASETTLFGCAPTSIVTSHQVDEQSVTGAEQVVAVAFTSTGTLVYQTREPSTLNIVTAAGLASASFGSANTGTRIELGGESVADTGHDIFHRDSGGGIACASCHAEGGDDGHVWEFNTIGRRRTQAVNIGLEGTEPFHWDGDMSGLHEIMGSVFVDRMGGVRQSRERLAAMSEWVFEQAPPAPIRSAEDAAALRGHDVFMDPDVGCANCHSGDKFTDNTSADVGTGERGHRFQVPSLVGIAYRAPFMHNGCANTLRERFDDPACSGGDQHGVTSRLNAGQIDDLVAYLESL